MRFPYFYSPVVFLAKNEWSCTSICLFFWLGMSGATPPLACFFSWLVQEQMYLTLFVLRLFNDARDVSANIRSADKSLAQPGRKQVTAIEDFEFHISYL